MGFLRDDIEVAMRKIHAACPDVVLQVWYDRGFRLAGYKRDVQGVIFQETYRVVLQPACRETNQMSMAADVDDLIKFWSA